MRLFLDTSSLIKLYHEETGSEAIQALIAGNTISNIFLSELTRIEFLAALWKKRRLGELTSDLVREIAQLFDGDTTLFSFIAIDNHIVEDACELVGKYGLEGLRSLDSIQLSTALALKGNADLFVTADKLLEELFKRERLPTSPH